MATKSCRCGDRELPANGCNADDWPEYVYSGIIDREALRHVTPLNLAAGVIRPVESLSHVRRQLVLNVHAGEAHVWFLPDAQQVRVGTDTPHLTVAPHPHPFVLQLPPGRHKFAIAAGGSLALNAVVTFLDLEER